MVTLKDNEILKNNRHQYGDKVAIKCGENHQLNDHFSARLRKVELGLYGITRPAGTTTTESPRNACDGSRNES